MVATKIAGPNSGRRSRAKNVRGAATVRGPRMPRGSVSRAESATQEAWSAVTEAVRSGKTQPANAARATRKAVRNVARTGAKQTGVAAETIAQAAEAVLMSAMSEATAAAKAAREAAREVETAVRKALRAIRLALRQRGHAAVNQATGTRRRTGAKGTASKRRAA